MLFNSMERFYLVYSNTYHFNKSEFATFWNALVGLVPAAPHETRECRRPKATARTVPAESPRDRDAETLTAERGRA